MKIIIYLLTFIAISIAIIFGILIYQQQSVTPVIPEEPVTKETEVDIAKRILVSQLETQGMSPEEKSIAEESARQQVEDDARLYDMAVAAGTVVPESLIQFSLISETYKHTDEAGLAAYIASLGLTEEQYRAIVLRRLTTATFIESKAAAQVSDDDVRKYYEALPASEREPFEIVELEIREKLQAQLLPKIRAELLAK